MRELQPQIHERLEALTISAIHMQDLLDAVRDDLLVYSCALEGVNTDDPAATLASVLTTLHDLRHQVEEMCSLLDVEVADA